jgi:hypothetical protein
MENMARMWWSCFNELSAASLTCTLIFHELTGLPWVGEGHLMIVVS